MFTVHFDDAAKYCTFKEEARCGPLPTSKFIMFQILLCNSIESSPNSEKALVLIWRALMFRLTFQNGQLY